MSAIMRCLAAGLLSVALGWGIVSAAHAQCMPFGGCSGPSVRIMKARVADEGLQLEVMQMVCEYMTKEVTIQVEDHQETKLVTECVMRPAISTQTWPLEQVKLYRGDRRRVQSSELSEALAELQYVLVCEPGQKLSKEWAELLRPETLVVFLPTEQAMPAMAAPAPPVEFPPAPVPVESAPAPVAPAPVEIAPPLPPSEPIPPLPGDAAPLGEPPVIPPALLTAKVADGQFTVRSVSQYQYEQTLSQTQVNAEGAPVQRTFAMTTIDKQETLASVPVDAVQGWQADGTELDADDLASRLDSYAGVLGVESAEPPSAEFLQLFQEDVLIIRTPSAAPPVAMPPPPAPGPFPSEAMLNEQVEPRA